MEIINEAAPVLCVSIHQNSYSDEAIKGAQVFYYTHSEKGEKAAEMIQKALLSVDLDNTRQIKANDTYYILKRAEVPTVIVECGFLSNREEADLLNTEEYQQKIAEAISVGIMEYLQY
ncbi:MAG: N-acetylmuramoyl-L-alanine amidase [Schaedlerella sp.]|nr:N-acetylmuramoyl-L-alanine amidase [Schaedlerella sp.]